MAGIVELLLDYGYSHAQIAREANASLTKDDLKRLKIRNATPLTVPEIRALVDQHSRRADGGEIPVGQTADILFLYLNREKRRFPTFLAEYMILYRDGFLDPEIISEQALKGNPKEAFKNFLVSSSYRIFARLLNVDYLLILKSTKDIAGHYVCVRPSARERGKYVISTMSIQQRPNAEEIWEYRHRVEIEHLDERETDGMVLTMDRHIIMFGDVANGRGLEMFVIDRPGVAAPRVLSGVVSTLSLSSKPIVGQFALLRIREDFDRTKIISGVFKRADCLDELAEETVIDRRSHLEVILSALVGPSTSMPIFTNGDLPSESEGL